MVAYIYEIEKLKFFLLLYLIAQVDGINIYRQRTHDLNIALQAVTFEKFLNYCMIIMIIMMMMMMMMMIMNKVMTADGLYNVKCILNEYFTSTHSCLIILQKLFSDSVSDFVSLIDIYAKFNYKICTILFL